jgi:hypothetical protein
VILGTAVAVLAGAGVAYAATPLNNYTAKLSFTSSKAGTVKKPAPTGYTETLTAMNTQSGLVAAPLIDIKTTIYGLKADLKDFPTCSATKIETPPKYNGNCPAGSEVTTGVVNAEIGGPSLSSSTAIPCNPDLAVYNGGGNTEWFFFTAPSPTLCGGLTTGQTAPYPGHITYKGKNMVIDVPLPPDVSTMVANHAGLYGSLTKEVLKVTTEHKKLHGKTVYSLASIGCSHGQRPWSVAYTAVPGAGATPVTQTVNGHSPCR